MEPDEPRYRLRVSADRPAPDGRSFLERLLDHALSIDTWKRVGITLVLGTFLFSGYLIYTNQERFFAVIDALTREEPAPLEVRLEMPYELRRQLTALLQALQPNAAGLAIWRVQRPNQMHLEAYVVAEEFDALVHKYEQGRWKTSVPLFIDNNHVNLLLAHLIRRRFACDDSRRLWDSIKRLPMAEICLVPIPPSPVIPMVAFLGAAFREPLTPEERDRIRIVLTEAAEATIWKR